MNKIYYLSTCDTCRRILREIDPPEGTVLQDIKTEPVTGSQLEQLRRQAGSYEALFNKRARLYASRKPENREPGEDDFRKLLLEHYTFLKRPVILAAGNVFVGNAPKTTAAAKEAIHR